MERLHVRYLRELVHRLRAGASQRAIAHDLGLARMTVQKYAQLAAAAGYLDASQPLPEAAELLARLGPPPQPPPTPSSVEPYRHQIEQSLAECRDGDHLRPHHRARVHRQLLIHPPVCAHAKALPSRKRWYAFTPRRARRRRWISAAPACFWIPSALDRGVPGSSS